MRKKIPGFFLYVDDYLGGTYNWKTLWHGAYLLLLCRQASDGSIPDDEAVIARMCGLKGRQFEEAWGALAPKFPVGDDGLRRNSRMEDVQRDRQEFLDKQRVNGSKGGRARWRGRQPGTDGQRYSGAIGSAVGSPPSGDGEPIPSHTRTRTHSRPRSGALPPSRTCSRTSSQPEGGPELATGGPGDVVPNVPTTVADEPGLSRGDGARPVTIPPSSNWSREASDDWAEHRGEPPVGRIGRALKSLVERLGWAVVRPVWQEFLAREPARFTSPETFASNFVAYQAGKWERSAGRDKGKEFLEGIARIAEKQGVDLGK